MQHPPSERGFFLTRAALKRPRPKIPPLRRWPGPPRTCKTRCRPLKYHSDCLTRQDLGSGRPPLKMPPYQRLRSAALRCCSPLAALRSVSTDRERLANHLVYMAPPHHRLRSLNGGKNGRSTNIWKFLVPANNEASGRHIGAKTVLRGLLHAAWPDHGWGSLGPARLGVTMISANQQGQGTDYPEPNWWNMVIPFIILTAGLVLGFFGVM